jgi:YkoY family integral membrane protein
MEGFLAGDLALIAMTVVSLVFIEGLLSADNALVLAMMVRHLPKAEQKRALRYGIWGAFGFRVIAVLVANVILKFWYLKVIGGLYLLYLAIAHFALPSDHGPQADGTPARRRFGSGFWGTVVSVELADIAFSIDSILAAVAMASGLPARLGDNVKFGVIITGGVLGILTMRFVAGYFIILLDRYRGLEPAAYGLVAWIGMKLVLGGFHKGEIIEFELNEFVFWGGMLAIIAFGFLFQPKPRSLEESAEIRAIAESFSDEMDLSSDAAEEPTVANGDSSEESEVPTAPGRTND